MDAGQLSRVLNSKQNLSPGVGQVISSQLFNSVPERGTLCDLSRVLERPEFRASGLLLKKATQLGSSPVQREVSLGLDAIRVMSDWYHVAILDLVLLKDFDPRIGKIAAYLGITEIEAKLAVERLLKLGLLVRRNGRLVKVSEELLSPTDIPSEGLRRLHSQMIAKAGESLEGQSIDRRYISSRTMAIDRGISPSSKYWSRNFWRKLERWSTRLEIRTRFISSMCSCSIYLRRMYDLKEYPNEVRGFCFCRSSFGLSGQIRCAARDSDGNPGSAQEKLGDVSDVVEPL